MKKKKTKINDQYATREAQNYEHPIPSREHILEYLRELGEPVDRDFIAKQLQLETEEELEGLRRRLKAMARDGQLITNRRRAYALPDKMNLIRGRVVGHRDGYGFIIPEQGGDDIFLTARQMRTLFHGDIVLASLTDVDRRGRCYGDVVEILERQITQVIGKLYFSGGVGFVQPINPKICHDTLVPTESLAGAQENHIVVVKLVSYPTRKHHAVGEVIEVLGEDMAPGMEIDIAIRDYGLPHTWSQDILSAVKSFPTEVTCQDSVGHKDLTKLPFVTIDGDDARDFDDAVYCEQRKSGWRLFVAIADVSHYVEIGNLLDDEALLRGNSVYFPANVIPMLPEALSNGLCSLNPHVKRLALVCEMSITDEGKVSRSQFYSAVICSHERLTYELADTLIKRLNKKLLEEYDAILPHLLNLHDVYRSLLLARESRGAMDFDTVETRIIFGDDRKIEKIVPTKRNDAHRLIEECMLAANVSAAKFLAKHKIAGLYRNHNGPTVEKLVKLRTYLSGLGLSLSGGDEPDAHDYGALIESIRHRADAVVIQMVMLRSLSQAVYQPNNIGHFGLAYPSYAHFTSPIRRYPDLLTHRAIKHIINGGTHDDFPYSHNKMCQLGDNCSMTERRADDATRDATSWLKCEYMMDKVGQMYSGTVSTVTSFGLFVTLDDIFIDGLVHVTSLQNDYYHFDPLTYRLRGERTGKVYRVGDKTKVKVIRVNLDDKQIDFELDASQFKKKKTKKRKR